MSNFSIQELLRKQAELSDLFDGREKIETEDLIKNGEIITITDIDKFVTVKDGEKQEVIVCVYAEDKTKFFFAGSVLKQNLELVRESLKMDFDKFREEIKKSPIKVAFERKKSKSDKYYTAVHFPKN